MSEIGEKTRPAVLHIKLDPSKHRAFKLAATYVDLTMQHAVELLIDKAISNKEILESLKQDKV